MAIFNLWQPLLEGQVFLILGKHEGAFEQFSVFQRVKLYILIFP